MLRQAGRRGFTHSDFYTRVWTYRELQQEEQFRVLVILAKMPEVSSEIRDWAGREVWRFYGKADAPEGAFNYERDRPPGKVIDYAGRKRGNECVSN